jgi:hypothetical protein
MKRKEGPEIQEFTPRKRDENEFVQSRRNFQKFYIPTNGREFFFSNLLIKAY